MIPSQTKTLIPAIPFLTKKIYFKRYHENKVFIWVARFELFSPGSFRPTVKYAITPCAPKIITKKILLFFVIL